MLYCPLSSRTQLCYFFFFFNDTATTEIYTLSLHDALPICVQNHHRADEKGGQQNNRKRAHADEVHLLEQIGDIAGMGKDVGEGARGEKDVFLHVRDAALCRAYQETYSRGFRTGQ